MVALFPFKQILLSTLPIPLQEEIISKFESSLTVNNFVIPFQRTLPMGFTWAVTIAHHFVRSIINQSFTIARKSNLFPHSLSPIFFDGSNAPFYPSEIQPLTLHIIEDIVVVFSNMDLAPRKLFHRILRNIFRHCLLPVAEKNPGSGGSSILYFIGCTWDLQQKSTS